MHFDVVLSVFIHTCTKKRRRAQFSIRADLICVCASDVCAGNFSHSATVTPTIPSVFCSRLVPLGSPYIKS